MKIQIVLDGDSAELCEKLRVELGLKTYKSVVVDALRCKCKSLNEYKKVTEFMNGKKQRKITKNSDDNCVGVVPYPEIDLAHKTMQDFANTQESFDMAFNNLKMKGKSNDTKTRNI